jgi:hypothetical protein
MMDHTAAGEFWEHLNTAMELARGYTPALSIALQKFQLEHSAAQVAFERDLHHHSDSYDAHSNASGGSGAASPTTMSPTTTPTPAGGAGASSGIAAESGSSAPTSPGINTGAAALNDLRRRHLRDGLRRSIDFCVVAGAAALSRAINNGAIVSPSAATSTSPNRVGAASTSSPPVGPTSAVSSPVLAGSGGGVPMTGRLSSPALNVMDAASPVGASPYHGSAPEPLPSPMVAADAPTAMGSPDGSAAFTATALGGAASSSTATLPLHAGAGDAGPVPPAATTNTVSITNVLSATSTPDALPPQPAATTFDGLAQAGSTVLTGDAALAVEHMMERRVGSFEDLRGLEEDREAQMQRTAELAHACANALAVVFLVPRSDALRRELQAWACNGSVHHSYGYVVNHQPLVAAVAAAANYPYKAAPSPSASTTADDADAAVLRHAAAAAASSAAAPTSITDDMMAVPPPPVAPLLDFLQAALTVDRNVELTWFAEGYRTMHLNALSNATHRCPAACRAVVTSCDVLLQAVLMLARKLDQENPGSMEWAGMVVHHIGAAGLGHEALEHVRRRQQQVAEDAATKMEQDKRMSRVSVEAEDE